MERFFILGIENGKKKVWIKMEMRSKCKNQKDIFALKQLTTWSQVLSKKHNNVSASFVQVFMHKNTIYQVEYFGMDWVHKFSLLLLFFFFLSFFFFFLNKKLQHIFFNKKLQRDWSILIMNVFIGNT